MTLHVLSTTDSLQRAAAALQEGDDILLVADATYLCLTSTLPPGTCLLQEDAALRGINPAANLVQVTMTEFVQLSAKHRHCLSW